MDCKTNPPAGANFISASYIFGFMPVRFTDELISSCSGTPPLGCRYCDRGAKMVLYITGICRLECFYCPLSEKKKGIDVVYANERLVEGRSWIDQVIGEAKRMRALGTGITGGDPMVVPERTIEVIRRLKETFGRKHHVHLYTTGPFDPSLLAGVKEAGLDEIRSHPPIETWSMFRYLGDGGVEGDGKPALPYHELIMEAVEAGMTTGLEVPAVVDVKDSNNLYSKGLADLIDYAVRQGLSFVNINELEASHTNMELFRRRGYELVGDSMAVMGSRELALQVISRTKKRYPEASTVLHLCTSVYKDSVQLRNRLKRMAQNLKRPFEVITDDGTFLRGVIETEDIEDLVSTLRNVHEVPDELMEIIGTKLLIAPWVLEELSEELEGVKYISEVYPTWDCLEVERIPL
jgi:pyruvate formate-lyase activating enzyme-like uncharacterized protein